MSDAGIVPGAGRIPRERVQGWRRWQTADLSAPQSGPAAGATPEQQAAERARREAERRDAELRALREQARRAGHAEGHAEGLRQGLEEGRRQGEAEGRAQGEAAARAESDAQLQAKLAVLDGILAQCERGIATLAADTAPALTRLALAVAQRLVADELRVRPEVIVRVVESALQETPAEARVRIHVHPDDAVLLHAHMQARLDEHDWRVVADEAIARGGCRLATAYGEIDATLQTRWAHIAADLGDPRPWQAP